jgi:hypothetical protein
VPTVGRVRRVALLIVLAVAGCGGDTGPEPAPSPAGGGAAVPDGGQRAGHGGDDAAAAGRMVRVPDRDDTPPLAILRFEPPGGAPPLVHRSPVAPRRAPAVELTRPAFRATAIIRDEDGGTGRIRLSVRYEATCDGRRERATLHRPPSQIERIRLTPGTRAPTERRRTARVRLPAGCRVTGEAFADATNAHGLESFSDPVRFVVR